ncbi:MAG: ParB/RepB/Spo0J family partition protein [Patescibacteria group bacterium]|nr:ParB/RepB/Spo0J family partition protein [Patescibacteria group bacterium]
MPLGRGLDSLIPRKKITLPAKKEEVISEIPLSAIRSNPYQPRDVFDEQAMEELVNSIREHGILQPLVVNKISDDLYELIAGERRLRAAKILNLEKVPVIIRSADEIKKLELSLIENLQRKDLNPMERARAYQRLIDEFNLTQEEVARKIGKARATVANTLRLLSLPPMIQRVLEEEKITEGHAKVLLSLDSPEKQEAMLKRILGTGMTVRETEQLIVSKRKKPIFKDQVLRLKEERLQEALGTKVTIKKRGQRGKIIIEFYSEKDLENLIKKLSL